MLAPQGWSLLGGDVAAEVEESLVSAAVLQDIKPRHP
jgi:hypothetical protein